MLSITDLKTGVIFEINNEPWEVLDYQHSKTGRAGAVLRTKIKNLKNGSTINKTFQSSEKFIEVSLERKRARYLYEDNGLVFMESSTYEQFIINKETAKEAKKYIKEGDEIQLVFYDNSPIKIDLPPKVTLSVTESMDANKGNTATAATKKITLETELQIDAPLFIKKGEKIIVDTRDSTYVGRAKKA